MPARDGARPRHLRHRAYRFGGGERVHSAGRPCRDWQAFRPAGHPCARQRDRGAPWLAPPPPARSDPEALRIVTPRWVSWSQVVKGRTGPQGVRYMRSILLVDDDIGALASVELILDRAGYSVAT